MNIQTVSLSQLVPSKANPRKSFDAAGIEGLAASIKTDGLLQNLIVQPVEGKGKQKLFSIIGGERRYRAFKLLEQRGELPADFVIPVEVREELSADDTLRLSAIENLQRVDLSPLEAMAALTKLVHKGTTLETVVAQTGLSVSTVKRRLALSKLCKEAKKALIDGTVSLSQAEAMTLGDHDSQRDLVENIERGWENYTAADIRRHLLDARPTVAYAIFPLEQYKGTITTDLFCESDTSYFDDIEQFMELQKAAVEKLAEAHRELAAWVEVVDGYGIPDWEYRTAKKKEAGGVVINLSPIGKVEVSEGLVKRKVDKNFAADDDNPVIPEKTKATYATPLRRYMAHHKSAAVQEVLLSNPRKAKEVGAVKALLELKAHGCLSSLAREGNPQSAYAVLEGQTRLLMQRLGFNVEADAKVWSKFPRPEYEAVDLYEAVKPLSDHELDELHTVLAALTFGQQDCDRLDTDDTLFNRVALDLGVNMKNHWKPDRSFLERRNSKQLVSIARECGYANGHSMIGSYKKSELVAGLFRHFTEASVHDWLPEAMSFPAVDPDKAKAEAGPKPA